MLQLHRVIIVLGSGIGLWVLGSFAGTMLNPANAAFWTGSLMWSLLAGVLVAPALLAVSDASSARDERG